MLAGCATTIEKTRSMPVLATYAAAKSPDALEHCIAGKLSWLAEPSVIRGEGEREIAFQYRGVTSLLLRLSAAANGSTDVQVRGRVGLHGRVKRDVEACL